MVLSFSRFVGFSSSGQAGVWRSRLFCRAAGWRLCQGSTFPSTSSAPLVLLSGTLRRGAAITHFQIMLGIMWVFSPLLFSVAFRSLSSSLSLITVNNERKEQHFLGVNMNPSGPLSPAHHTSAHPDPGCRWSGSSAQWGTPAPPSAGAPPLAPPRSTRFLWATRKLRWITFKRPQLQIWSMILVSFTKHYKKTPKGADLV